MNNLDLNLFKTFYIVAKHKNFTKASEELFISQPAVTKSIKKLEEQLNTKLFKRTNNGIVLTQEGEIVYSYAERLYNIIIASNNLIDDINNAKYKNLNIGIPTHLGTFYLVDYLNEFNNKFPNTHINIINKSSEEMLRMLERRELDIVIDTDMAVIENDTIGKLEILKLNGCFVAGKKYKDLLNKNIKLNEINNYPLILPGKTTANRKMIDLYFKRKNIVLNPLIEANSSSISKKIILNNLGIGWMIREFISEDLKNKELYEIKIDIEEVSIPVSIAYNKIYLNNIVKEFIKMFKK